MGRLKESPQVSVPAGRWGSRRVRVTECQIVLKVETIYDQMLRDGKPPMPGGHGQVVVTSSTDVHAGQEWRLVWESVPNSVWAHGRLFFRCPACDYRATRLYVPNPRCRPRCRTCWGLTYTSRTRTNYKGAGSFLLRSMGITTGEWARMETADRRAKVRVEARARYAARRA